MGMLSWWQVAPSKEDMSRNQLSKYDQTLLGLEKFKKKYSQISNYISAEIWREESDFGILVFVSQINPEIPNQYLGLEVIQRVFEI